jgi:hypothetical protein
LSADSERIRTGEEVLVSYNYDISCCPPWYAALWHEYSAQLRDPTHSTQTLSQAKPGFHIPPIRIELNDL